MFVLDQGVKKSIEMARILKEVLPHESHEEGGEEAAETDEGEPNEEVGESRSSDEEDAPTRRRPR
jgi:hypothetical protein